MGLAFASLPVLRHAWVAGIILSAICLVLQSVLSAFRPALRHVDQKIIIQLSAARLVLSYLQYVYNTATYGTFNKSLVIPDAISSLSLYLDAVVVCWMCLYYKNIRHQLLSKIPLQKWNFTALSVVIWSATIPVGVLFFYQRTDLQHISVFHTIFDNIKAIVMVNCVLVYVIFFSCEMADSSESPIVRKGVVSFILVTLMATEAIIRAYCTVNETVIFVFYLLGSFHVLALTVIFVIPAKAPSGVACA